MFFTTTPAAVVPSHFANLNAQSKQGIFSKPNAKNQGKAF
jgi:hypothetical protein